MKRVLITGKYSYVGNELEKWLANNSEKYSVDKISLRDDSWHKVSFSQYDVIVHVAGIAHINAKKSQEELYYKINRDLTIEVAKKAKREHVKQFIFMSSIIVYGESNILNNKVCITKDSKPNPTGFYGNSKLEAEEGIRTLEDTNFKIAIVRSPMIYGYNSKGNFPKLVKLAGCTPIFPKVNNRRSALYISNLTEFLKQLIDKNDNGIFFPQNSTYFNTSALIYQVRVLRKRKIFIIRGFSWAVHLAQRIFNMPNKVFGTFYYDQTLSEYKDNSYQHVDFKKSIEESIDNI